MICNQLLIIFFSISAMTVTSEEPFNATTVVLPDLDSVNVTEDNDYNQTNQEKRLLKYLMRDYEQNVRPVKDAASPVVIRLGITLTQIFDLDEKNQVLTTNVWLDQEWIDEFLRWKPEEFGNLNAIRIPCELIWLPDIVLYNSADDYTRGYMRTRAMISPDGNVFWPPPTKFRSTCPVDVTYFPFDDQTCTMKFGSWIYNGFQLDLYNRTSEVDLSNYVHNGEWDLLETQIVRNVVSYPCCIEPFPDVKVILVIRRKTLYYMYNIVLPCMMMSVLTLLVFCLPPDSGEKVALGVTVLLAFSVFMLAISEKLPETSESIPLLGIYLTAVMAITSISVIMTVIVLNFHYRGPIRKEMPQWIKKFLLDKVVLGNAQKCSPPRHFQPTTWSTEVGYQQQNPYPFPYTSGTGTTIAAQLIKAVSAETTVRGGVTADPSTSFACQREDYFDENLVQVNKDCGKEPLNSLPSLLKEASNRLKKKPRLPSSRASNQATTNENLGPPPPPPPSSSSTKESGSTQEEMLKILRYLLWRQELEDKHNKIVHEWRLLALAIDKVLFWVFLVITVTSSLFFLVIIPVQRRGLGLVSSSEK